MKTGASNGQVSFLDLQRLCRRDTDDGAACLLFVIPIFFSVPHRSAIDFARCPKDGSRLPDDVIHIPEMPFPCDDGRAVTKSQPISLLRIIHIAFGDNTAGLSVFIKNGISDANIAHCGKTARCGDFRIESKLFSLFLGNLHIRRVELPIAVRLQDAENVSDNALLPVDQLERLPCPRPLRMAQALNKSHGIIRSGFVIVRVLCHELRRCVVRQFPQAITPIKKAAQ